MQITRKLIVSNTVWSAFAQGSVMLINLLVLPLFITNLGAELYGIWVLSGVVLGYAGVFDFGFTQGLQKYVAEAKVKQDDQELSEVVVTGLGILSSIGVSLGALIYFSAPSIVGFFSIGQEHVGVSLQLLRISALFSIVMWPLRIIDVVLNASMRIKELSILNGCKSMVQSLLMLVMISNSSDIVQIKWVVATAVLGVSLFGIVLLRRYIPEISWCPLNFKICQAMRMQRFSMGMFYGALVGALGTKVDALILGKMLTMESVAVYAVVSRPLLLYRSIEALFLQTLMPSIYNLVASKQISNLEILLFEVARFRLLISSVFAIVMFAFVDDFIYLWVGEAFREYSDWARLLCVVPLFTVLGAGNAVARGLGHLKVVNLVFSVQILLNVTVSVFLIGRFGVGGPILGTFLAVCLVGDFVVFPYYCKLSGLPCKSSYLMSIRGLAVVFPFICLSYLYVDSPVDSWVGLFFGSGFLAFTATSVVLLNLFSLSGARGLLAQFRARFL